MASSYPGSLDSFTTIASDKKTSDSVGGRTHRDMHNDLGDAVEAVQAELGTDPAGGSATVKARFDVIEANDWVSAARIAAGAVGSSELADGAVTAAKLSVQLGNLLQSNQASVETNTTGFYPLNACTLARSTSWAGWGSASLAVTCSATGTASVGTTGNSTSDGIPVAVTPGQTITVTALVKNNTGVTRNAKIGAYFYNSGGAYQELSESSTVTGSESGVLLTHTCVVPTGAAYVGDVVTVGSGSASDIVYMDCFGVWLGAGGLWQPVGVPIPNLGVRANPSNSAQAQVWNPGNNTWITV